MTRPVRLLFTIGSMGGGGAERQVLEWLNHLDRSRFEPVLHLTERRGQLLDDVPPDVPIFAFSDRQPSIRMNYPGRIHRHHVRDLAELIGSQRIDLLCAVTFLSALVAAESVRRGAVPWAAVEMADPRLDFPNTRIRFRTVKRWMLRRAYRQADALIAVSGGVCEGIAVCYGVPEQRIDVVPNFVDVGRVDRLARAAGPPLPAEFFHVAVLGRLDDQKGHRYLIEAAANLIHQRGLRKLKLHFLGEGPRKDDLQRLVRERSLGDHVVFAGFVANPFAYLRRCALFCLPSLYEGLPLSLVEAMACRVPVLASDCPSGPREVLQNGRFGRLIPPADPGALAAALEDAMRHQAQWREHVEAARTHVEKTYSPQAVMPHLEQLFLQLSGRAPSRRDGRTSPS